MDADRCINGSVFFGQQDSPPRRFQIRTDGDYGQNLALNGPLNDFFTIFFL
jgi:hypothetical protein